MRIQDAVLDALEKNRGEYLSGEQLASSLGVSRNAVWKAIQKLEEAGHKIRAVPKRGYTLAPESDVLTVQSVSRFLDTDMPVYLQVQTEVTSTNTLLKAQAEQGAPEGTVLIAESQTAGKGRLGRHFTSPPGTGIYFSLLLRPHCTAEKSLFITTTAAVAVCEAIEQVTGLNPQIKWVNDVYLNEKKVCGILTEASVDFENGGLNWAVLGIGINIAVPEEGFPEEIRSIAGEEVLQAVKLLTKEKGYDMQTYVTRIRQNPIAYAVKGADRLHNLRTASCTSRHFRQKYITETETWYLSFRPDIPAEVEKLKQTLTDENTDNRFSQASSE